MTEAEAIECAVVGDRRGLRCLYDRHAARVYSIARRIAGDDDVAADCSQETWLRVARALPSFRGEAAFSTWLQRITANTTIEIARRRGRRALHELPFSASHDVLADGRLPDHLLHDRVDAALERLPDGMRTVLVMHDIEGFKHEEIGRALGIAVGTSKSQLYRARVKLRAMLSPLVREPEETPCEDRMGAR